MMKINLVPVKKLAPLSPIRNEEIAQNLVDIYELTLATNPHKGTIHVFDREMRQVAVAPSRQGYPSYNDKMVILSRVARMFGY